MGNILKLDKLISNQIAAGEVVERPLSVVKELLENSLDAGAKNIEIRIKNGGLNYIVIQDDGIGMDEGDLRICTERYATSKLKKIADLNSLNTFGFRGEALPSIASVSRFSIITRTKNSEMGHHAFFLGGDLVSCQKSFCDLGTRIEVRDLFFNVPARLEFMRSKRSEASGIEALIRSLSYVNPQVNFRYFKDDVLVFDQKDLGGDNLSRAYLLLGEDTKGHLYEFSDESEYLKISGAFCSPLVTRRDSRGLKVFVNNRLIKDKKIESAIKSSYRTLLEVGQYPICAINININSKDVDINVHPRKSEVRFKEERKVVGHVIHMLSKALQKTPWLKQENYANKSIKSIPNNSTQNFFAKKLDETQSASKNTYDLLIPQRNEFINNTPVKNKIEQKKLLISNNFSSLRVIGQIQNTYLILEGDQGLVLIDQHAAHERVMFEKIRSNPHDLFKSQDLLVPQMALLSNQEMALVLDFQEELVSLGIALESFGEEKIIIRAIPGFLKNINISDFIKDILSELKELGHMKSHHEIYDHVSATLACHSAIRAGQKLNILEIEALLRSMDNIDISAHCPHGRPVVKSFTHNEIEKWFHRT